MFIKTTSLIIPTKNRLNNLNRFFRSIQKYHYLFNEIIIIDSSDYEIKNDIKKKFLNNKKIKIFDSKPSTSIQRNIGLKRFNKKNKFIMFCDDDIVFNNKAILNMDKFIKKKTSFIGYGFNLIEKKNNTFIERFKKNKLFSNYNLYSSIPGTVCNNGWHTKISNISRETKAMWLSTQASVYRVSYLNNSKFNTSLGNYSYLEDLFFSYNLYKKGGLVICHSAKYKHPNNIERTDYNFGKQEFINRYKFVKKFKLNNKKFYITALIKLLYNLINISFGKFRFLPKFFGNVVGIIQCLKN